jgi:hypothetical protein
VGGYLRITFESSALNRTATSNALELSEEHRNEELIVTIDWANQAVLKIKE